jgi:hypothetical protein
MVNQGGAQLNGHYQQTARKLGLLQIFFKTHQWKCQNANEERKKNSTCLLKLLKAFVRAINAIYNGLSRLILSGRLDHASYIPAT